MKWPLVVWYSSMSIVTAAWLVILSGVWLGEWDATHAILPLLLGSLLVGAFGRSCWIRRSRGKSDEMSAEEALKGYPRWW